MIDGLKPYPAYKDSGVPWLGKVPEHWEVRRLKRIARLNPSKSEVPIALRDGQAVFLPMERVGSDGRFDASEVRSISDLWNGFTYFRRGDVIVAKITPCFENGKGACLENLPTAIGFGSTEFHVIRPSLAVTAPYVYQVTTLSEFRRLGADEMTGAAGQQRVPAEFIANFLMPLPPLPEQTAIVRFLDYMDRRIRRSIRAKQKLIKLLEEYRQALIHQAVTGKIDVRTGQPYPAYKDSGVPWLGLVPEHWELKPLKRLVRLNASVLPDTTPADYEFRYIDIGTVGTGFLTREPQQLRFGNSPSRARRVLHMGDTIISTVRTYLKAVYYVDRDAEALVCSTGFAVLTPGPSTQPKYVSYLVQSNTFTDRVTAESVGTAYPAIAEGRLGSFYVPVPLIPEQTAIVEYLDAQTAKLDAAIAVARREIELLREYRERLIADVVTGKVDVRGVAAQLPEEPPEEEAGTEEEEPVAEELATVDSQGEVNGEE
jgi:restriction endonuclease S subunit